MITQEISMANGQGSQGSPHYSSAGESNNMTDQGQNLSFTTATKKITHGNEYIYVCLPKWRVT